MSRDLPIAGTTPGPRPAAAGEAPRRTPSVLRRSITLLSWVVPLLLAGQVLHLLSDYRSGNEIELFDFGAESNLPTFFTTLLLLLSALALGAVAWATRRTGAGWVRHWQGLAIIFFLLAIDESAMVHERIGSRLKDLGDAALFSGAFHYGWSLLYLLIASVIAVTYLRFLVRLPVPTRWGFVLAGGCYVLGALGIEMLVGESYAALNSPEALSAGDRLTFDLIETAEELLEMVGLLVFLRALVGYLERTFPALRLEVPPHSSSEGAHG